MKFRAVRPAEASAAEVSIVPLFDDKQTPKSLARGKRAIVERLAGERGATSLYNVFTHVGGDKDGRVVVVGAGKRAEYDAERARNIASAGIKSLWRTDAKAATIYADPTTIGEQRATQAAVEGAHFAMWRPEAHRSKPEDRRLPPLGTVTIAVDGNVKDALRRGDAVGQAVNLARRLA
ncbi:MAG TPA: M17 family peptidase N-terminal domain-containing protein, partial [Candidatus Limnocylindria bacterium]